MSRPHVGRGVCGANTVGHPLQARSAAALARAVAPGGEPDRRAARRMGRVRQARRAWLCIPHKGAVDQLSSPQPTKRRYPRTVGRFPGLLLAGICALAFATAALAVVIATVTAWALCKWAFEVPFVFSALAAGETVLLALAFVLGIGTIATWRVLSAKAAPYLRAE